jgi:SRSO17 transposase
MDAETIMQLKPQLDDYLREFAGCFGRSTVWQHLGTYVQGQLSNLPRKSIEPMADAAGVPPRNLQQFLSLYRWDEAAMRDCHQQRIARQFAHRHSVGLVDDTSFVKKGDQTAGVQRQYCGVMGKTENCVVSVHLGYATPETHSLLDTEIYLPETTWHLDRDRCRAAGVPDDVVYRPKWQIALEQIRRAQGNGLRFAWLTFDEGYGSKTPFLRALDDMGQNYVAEVPSDFGVWTQRPDVLYQAPAGQRPTKGRQRKYPRLKVQHNPTVEARDVRRYSPLFRRDDWQTYRVKDGTKGPALWEAKRLCVWLPDAEGLPGSPHSLLVCCSVENPNVIKYFLSNAPESTPIETLLLVAFSRWKIERLFEDTKEELGMDHFEVRQYIAVRRHLIVSCVSYQFLAEFLLEHRKKKSGLDHPAGAHGRIPTGVPLDDWGTLFTEIGRVDQSADLPHPEPQPQSSEKCSQTHHPDTPYKRIMAHQNQTLLLDCPIAL